LPGDCPPQRLSNVPIIIQHYSQISDWGDGDKGTLDFSLNILSYYFKSQKEQDYICKQGRTSLIVWDLHHKFANWLTKVLNQNGGTLDRKIIANWIRDEGYYQQIYSRMRPKKRLSKQA
jgi:hypothetical protein